MAQGHDDGYTQFLVSSGPYMIDGAAKLDFTEAAASQAPVAGLDLGRYTLQSPHPRNSHLVQDPSWVASSDDLRPAYPDRIEIQLGPAKLGPHPPPYPRIVARLFREVGDGRWDVVLGTHLPLRDLGCVPIRRSLRRSDTEQVAIPDFIAMNLAVPPFDDVHAALGYFSLAGLDKAALVKRANRLRNISPSYRGVVARHLAPDPLEDGLLSSWRPSWDVAPDEGDVAAAKAEMRRSKYDADGDGLCDGAACDQAAFVVDAVYPATLLPPMRDALEAIGIRFNLRRVPRNGGGRGPADHVAATADRGSTTTPLVPRSSQDLLREGLHVTDERRLGSLPPGGRAASSSERGGTRFLTCRAWIPHSTAATRSSVSNRRSVGRRSTNTSS